MSHTSKALIPLIALLAVSTPAAAQSESSDFVTIDRFDGTSKLVGSFGYVDFEQVLDNVDFSAYRMDLFGQFVAPPGYGGYVQLAVGYASVDGDFLGMEIDDSNTGINNVELGGLYVVRAQIPVFLRGGITLPTGTEPDEGDAADGNAMAGFARINDFAQSPVDVTALRLSASPLIRSGQAFFRGDVGLDIPVTEPDGLDYDTQIRLNVGAGVATGAASVMAELLTLGTIEDVEDDEDRFIHMLGLSARLTGSGARPFAAVQLPLDDSIQDFVNFVAVVGVDYVLPNED